AFFIDVHDQLEIELLRELVPELDHVPEFPRRIDVHQRERQPAREERLACEVQQHRGVFADRIEHHRIFELGSDFADDPDALGFELFEVRKLIAGHGRPAVPGARGAYSNVGSCGFEVWWQAVWLYE